MPISGVKFTGPPITIEDIAQLEKTLTVKLPGAYRDFLLQYNGGRPTPEDTFGVGNSGSLMSVFYAVKEDDPSHTIAHQRFVYEERIPSDLLPIAVDMGGSQVCMGIAPANYGQIFFWAIYDEPRPEDKDQHANIWKLADDFASFLETFREEIDDDDDE